jgi:integrase/recombinase XerC
VTALICGFVSDSETRVLTLVRPGPEPTVPVDPAAVSVESGLADVVTLQRRRQARISAQDEESFFLDTLSEYQWARDATGLAPTTLDGLIKPVVEVCEFYGTVPWQLTSREVDRYFAGPGKRAPSTLRGKINKIDAYFAFLEQRYADEIMRHFGQTVESPIDVFNRPRHRGDFGLRIPPSQTALRDFFGRWREDLPNARKYLVACRDHVMTTVAYLSGVRAAELCAVCMGDLHWEHGQWGRFVVLGKGAHGSGPRPREAYMFQEGRALL